MKIYRTEQFENEMNRAKLNEDIEKLAENLKPFTARDLNISKVYIERMPPFLKRRQGDYRILGVLKKINDVEVLCLVDLLHRSNSLYDEICKEPAAYWERNHSSLLNERLLESWVNAQTGDGSPPPLPALPEELMLWLQPPEWSSTTDVIYESEEWIKAFRQRDVADNWSEYYDLVCEIAGLQIDEPTTVTPIAVHSRGRYSISYCLMNLRNRHGISCRILFLIAPFRQQPTDEQISQLNSALPFLAYICTADENATIELEDIIAFARRSYPDYMLADKEVWHQIEKEEEANLALSGEEEGILHKVLSPSTGSSGMPIFINGRAGSGKSTMLMYLFAHYCYRKLAQKDLRGDMIFITYNEGLLETIKSGALKILEAHHSFLTQSSVLIEKEEFGKYFQPFQTFLLNLLPPDEREKFSPSKYVNYLRFKRAYLGETKPLPSFKQPRRFSPEICWYVIRTFIKGYNTDGYMSPDNYVENVPKRGRVVSDGTFREIHSTVWKQWYETHTVNGDFWDDLDLIRVVQMIHELPKYSAIFCDEAQDFTRLELQLIMQLSEFSKYDLESQYGMCLPFAFAGDPFQTLNPTGFRWASVRAAFHEEIISSLDPFGRLGVDVNFEPLDYNYRSSPPIVGFTNWVLLWRRILFNITELKPQKWWQQGTFPSPVKFVLDQNISADVLKQKICR